CWRNCWTPCGDSAVILRSEATKDRLLQRMRSGDPSRSLPRTGRAARSAMSRSLASLGITEKGEGLGMTAGRLVLPMRLLSRLDASRKSVLLRGQRAGCVRREDAGRVVGAIEVEDGLAADGRLRVEEAASAVALVAIGLIAEDHEEIRLAGLQHWIQLIRLSAELENERPG